MSTNLLPVAFHGRTLYVFNHDDEPHAPMKPIVENIGLDWMTQYRKLIARSDRFCIVIMTIQVPGDDQARRTLVMPVRKLAGWLMTIHPGKVKPELRETLLAYQRECDEVLWQHWRERYDAAVAAEPQNDPAMSRGAAAPFGPDAPHAPLSRPDHNLLREYRLISPNLAQSYLIECGITPAYVNALLEEAPLLPGAALPEEVISPPRLIERLIAGKYPQDDQCWYVPPVDWPDLCHGFNNQSSLRWLQRAQYLKCNAGRMTYRPPTWVDARRAPCFAIRKSLQEVRHG